MRNLDLLIPKDADNDDHWTWATVTQADPLKIRLDGETNALPGTPDTLEANLAVNNRVRVHMHKRRVVVVGLAGGFDSDSAYAAIGHNHDADYADINHTHSEPFEVSHGKVHLTSGANADYSAGNAPPLRIGNLSGNHMRIDSNEIIAMAGDSTSSRLHLNANGAGVTLGDQVNATTDIRGSDIILTSGNGDVDVATGANGRFRYIDYPETTNGANVHMASGGQFFRVSSSQRFKENIRPLAGSASEIEDFLSLEPKRFNSTLPGDAPARDMVGFIAEDADALGLNEWVEYDDEGECQSFAYPAWVAALQAIVRHQATQIEDLQSRVDALEAQ